MADSGTIVSAKDFANTPAGLQQRWQIEISAAKENQKKWWEEAEKICRRYTDERHDGEPKSRLNLFHANVNVELALVYGQLPKVDVSRRFSDASDDEARVGGELLERILNTDIQRDDDGFRSGLRYSLLDWKLTGFGQVRLRYEMGKEVEEPGRAAIMRPNQQTGQMEEAAPAVLPVVKRPDERIATDYVHWKDFLWSPCRIWHEATWVAFRNEMTRDALVKRFGEQIGRRVPLEKRNLSTDAEAKELKEVWSRASVWEIWCKDEKAVYWFVEGFDQILDSKPDPLGLEGFWPCPKPLLANPVTTRLMPVPEFRITKDLYDEIDEITYRLKELEKCAKLAWCYDKAFPDLSRIMEEATEGQGIGVDKWGAFAEKGGLKGVMDFVPIEDVVNAIQVLSQRRLEKIQLLDQVIGLSAAIRGQSDPRTTATANRIEAGFASTRLQTEQDEVARFASDHQKIRAEIISKRFDAQTIIDRSNVLRTPDAQLAPQAAAFVKSNLWAYRVEVKADSIALRDYATLKQERVETIAALSQIFTAGVPMVQLMPQMAPFLMELGKWLLAATKGSQQIEPVFDKIVSQIQQALQQPKPPPPPDPKLQAAQVKAQAEGTKAKLGVVQTMVDAKAHVAKTSMDVQAAQAKHAMEMQALEAKRQADAAKQLVPLPIPPGGP